MHILTHTTEKANSCPTCGRRFSHITSLHRHEVERNIPRKYFVGQKIQEQLSYPFGNVYFFTGYTFGKPTSGSTRRRFKCELCPRISLSRADLQKHVQVVHENQRNHPCTFCDKRFSTSSNMRRHVDARHSGNNEKIHSCDKCESRSNWKENLAHHARRHNPVKRLECYFCKIQFAHFSKLVTHSRGHTLEH